jgi:hypothetical protein
LHLLPTLLPALLPTLVSMLLQQWLACMTRLRLGQGSMSQLHERWDVGAACCCGCVNA